MSDSIANVTSNGGWNHQVNKGNSKTYTNPNSTTMKVKWEVSAASVKIFLNDSTTATGTYGVGAGLSTNATTNTGVNKVKVEGLANGATYKLSLVT